MNFMEVYEEHPYYLRAGFWVFLQSERVRHLEDVKKIDEMLVEIEKVTPTLKEGVGRERLLKFSKRFVEFKF
jgi:hypothetical protein